MTVLKLALATLVMWTRDHYFPASYTQATWHRLAPFFRLPGRVVWGTDMVTVELRPFNDRRLTRDLAVLCQRVEAAQPRLPDGRRVVLWVADSCRSTVSAQPCQAASYAAFLDPPPNTKETQQYPLESLVPRSFAPGHRQRIRPHSERQWLQECPWLSPRPGRTADRSAGFSRGSERNVPLLMRVSSRGRTP